MSVLTPSPKRISWPLTISWPTGTPDTAMPDIWRLADDGRLEAMYRNVDELREGVQVLTLIDEARALGVVHHPEPQPNGVAVVHADLDALADYLAKEGLAIVPGDWDWRPHPHDPTRLVPWVPVAPARAGL